MVRGMRICQSICIAFSVVILDVGCTPHSAIHHNPPASATDFSLAVSPEYRWKLRTDTYSQGTLSFGEGPQHKADAEITVTRFVPHGTNGHYWINLNSLHKPISLAHVHGLHFRMKATGLSYMRVIFWNTENSTWCTTPIATSSSWETVSLPWNRFRYYTVSGSSNWTSQSNAHIGDVTMLSFQVGTLAKTKVTEHGTLSISDIGFD